jgi:hypothetical protein
MPTIIDSLEKTINAININFGSFHSLYNELSLKKAELYRKINKYQEAIKIYEINLRIMSSLKGSDSEESLNIMHLLSITLSENNDLDASIKILKMELQMRKESLGQYNPKIIQTMESLYETLIKHGKQNEAAKLLNEIEDLKKERMQFEHEPGVNNIEINRIYYWKYLELFKKGVFQCTRKEFDSHSNLLITRNYFSGAIYFNQFLNYYYPV